MESLTRHRMVKPLIFNLINRSFILLYGQKTSSFLQGLISQDIRKLCVPHEDGIRLETNSVQNPQDHLLPSHTTASRPFRFLELPTIPSLFLASSGKTLLDCFIYNISAHDRDFDDASFLIDCSEEKVNFLLRLLTIRKLRLPITIYNASSLLRASQWLPFSSVTSSLLSLNNMGSVPHTELSHAHEKVEESENLLDWLLALNSDKLDSCAAEVDALMNQCISKADTTGYALFQNLRQNACISFVSEDPRYHKMGYRFIYPAHYEATMQSMFQSAGHVAHSLDEWKGICSTDTALLQPSVENYSNTCSNLEETDIYSHLRYLNGIPEGSKDIPMDEAIPIYYNLDFLGYISNSKGCYVGQELTSRISTLLQIRKRLFLVLPIYQEPYGTPKQEFPNMMMDPKRFLIVGFPKEPLPAETTGLAKSQKAETDIIHKFGTLIASNGIVGMAILRSWGTITVLKREKECQLLEGILSKMYLYLIEEALYDKKMSVSELVQIAHTTVRITTPPYIKEFDTYPSI